MNRDPRRYRAKKAPPAGKGPSSARRRPIDPQGIKQREKARREAALRAKEEARRQRLLRKERRARLFRLPFVAGVVFFALYWCLVALFITTRSDGNEEALPLKLFTEGERKEDKTFEVEEVTFGGAQYLPVTALEPYMAISQFGDYSTRSVLLCESGEYATFYLGTPCAVINGCRVNLKEDVFLQEDVLYLPLDFYTDKMNCFTFAESAPLAAGVLTFQKEKTPKMNFSPEPETFTVDAATIPAPPVLEETEPTA